MLAEWLAVGLFTSVVTLWLCLGGAADRANNLVYDALMATRGGATDERILIVAIDNRSLEALGRWPWPRETHARLIERLQSAGVAAVGYDVLFVEPAPGDADLARAMARAGNVVLPMAVDPMSGVGGRRSVLLPLPALREAAAGLGHVNLTVDPDGVVRRLPLSLVSGDTSFPQLSLRMAAAAGAIPAHARRPDAAPVLVSWRGPPGQFRTISFVDVLRGEAPREILKDKLVLVGMTADGQGDRYAAPVGGGRLYPGVEIQAATLDTVLGGSALRPLPAWALALSSLGLLWLVLSLFLVLGPTRSLAAAALAVVAVLALVAAAFHLGVWIPPAGVLAGLLLAYPLWSWRRLEAASAWFRVQLETFLREDAISPPLAGGDPVQRQLDAMRWAVDRLRNLGRFIADALKSLPDATLVVTSQGRVLMANDKAEALFGASPLDSRDLGQLLHSLGVQAGEGTGEIVTRSGSVQHIEEAPLVDASGTSVGRIVRLADLTAIRTAQRQREEALQLLSHDMRAPQISILTLLERAGADMQPDLSRRIADNARLTLRLAEGYVQLARAESQSFATGAVNLLDVMTDAADTLWPQAQHRNVRISLPELPDPAEMDGDRPALTRAFLNLFDNAVKFSPPGSLVEVTLEPLTNDAGHWWVCSVEDRGPGVPPELCRRIFRPFERADERPAGVGLGLAFVRTVIERHGGDARCEGRPGGGARFVLSLPRGD